MKYGKDFEVSLFKILKWKLKDLLEFKKLEKLRGWRLVEDVLYLLTSGYGWMGQFEDILRIRIVKSKYVRFFKLL